MQSSRSGRNFTIRITLGCIFTEEFTGVPARFKSPRSVFQKTIKQEAPWILYVVDWFGNFPRIPRFHLSKSQLIWIKRRNIKLHIYHLVIIINQRFIFRPKVLLWIICVAKIRVFFFNRLSAGCWCRYKQFLNKDR